MPRRRGGGSSSGGGSSEADYPFGKPRKLGRCPICGRMVTTSFPLMYRFLVETVRDDLLRLCRHPEDRLLFHKVLRAVETASRKRKPHRWYSHFDDDAVRLATYPYRDPRALHRCISIFGWPILYDARHIAFLLFITEIFGRVDPRWHHFSTHVPCFKNPFTGKPSPLTYPNLEAYYRFIYQLPPDPALPEIRLYPASSEEDVQTPLFLRQFFASAPDPSLFVLLAEVHPDPQVSLIASLLPPGLLPSSSSADEFVRLGRRWTKEDLEELERFLRNERGEILSWWEEELNRQGVLNNPEILSLWRQIRQVAEETGTTDPLIILAAIRRRRQEPNG